MLKNKSFIDLCYKQEKSYFFDIIMKGVITMSKYKVGAYIRLSKDDSYNEKA